MSAKADKKRKGTSWKKQHAKYINEDRLRKNRMRREIANLKRNPNDEDCYKRIQAARQTMNIPLGMLEDIEKALKLYRDRFNE